MKLSHRICIADTCGREFNTRLPETRTGLRSFWKHYCPQCRTKGNAGSPAIVEQTTTLQTPKRS